MHKTRGFHRFYTAFICMYIVRTHLTLLLKQSSNFIYNKTKLREKKEKETHEICIMLKHFLNKTCVVRSS